MKNNKLNSITTQTPDWVKHAVFYQIFPDRFAIRPEILEKFGQLQIEPWDSLPTTYGYKGGNLGGVTDRLSYLKDLGINALYLTPIFQSACNHRYHTHDYFQVDPMLGGNEALEELIKEAHQLGIRVILDGVFNHCSRGFFFFNDLLENSESSPWRHWFHIEEFPLAAYNSNLKNMNYRCWDQLPALPIFNLENPATREYIMQIGEYWLRKGIDGWRLDVASEIQTKGFWEEFRQRMKAINPDAYLVGEIWSEAPQWLDGSKFDAVMNYQFTQAVMDFVCGDLSSRALLHCNFKHTKKIDSHSYSQRIDRLLNLYPWEIQLAQMNLIDSHDTTRFLTLADGETSAAKLAALLMFTFPGAPCVYYGDEVGLEGGQDPDCRRTFPDEKSWNPDLLNTYRQLIHMRHEFSSLRVGKYKTLYSKDNIYVFMRELANEAVIVAVNCGHDENFATINLSEISTQPGNPNQIYYGKESGKCHMDENHQLTISIAARSGVVIA